MVDFGILSLLPPILAIILAIKTKQVYLSLSAGIFLGYLIIANWNPLIAIHKSISALVNVFHDSGNTQTVLFCLLMGALIAFSHKSGGIKGFINYIEHTIQKQQNSKYPKTKAIQLLAAITGVLIFIETNISALTVGALFKPLFNKFNLSKAKLAYIVDSSSAPSSALIPFNAWGAFIMGLLLTQGIENPFKTLLGALIMNLYPIITLILLFTIITFSFSFGPMKQSEIKSKNFKAEAKPIQKIVLPTEDTQISKPLNFIIPILTLVITMPIYLIITGYLNIENSGNTSNSIWDYFSNGNGSLSVLYAVLTALFIGGILYKTQNIITIRKQVDIAFKGMGELLPLATLMVLAFMISKLCKDLGTGIYIAQLAERSIHLNLIPALIFLLSSFIAFSTGTSWGTFAIMISIAIPLSDSLGINPSLLTAAVISGGVFGDHCSPISDTTIISSMASGCDHIEHVKTQLPYAMLAGTISLIGFLLLGFIF